MRRDPVSPISENLFKLFLTSRNIPWKRIVESSEPTPDYEVTLGEQVLLAEVKEIEENDDESAALATLRETGKSVLPGAPGGRIRSKIGKGAKQLRSLASEATPTMVVLYNNTPLRDHTRDYDVLTAMYGFESYKIAELADGTFGAIDHRHGPKSTVNLEHNTSLSAVGVLRGKAPEDLRLDIYHNYFARVPLDASKIPIASLRHFQATVDSRGRPNGWTPSRAEDEY